LSKKDDTSNTNNKNNKSNATEDGPQGEEIFIGSREKHSSDLEKKVFDDLQKDQSINLDEIVEMTIRQLENNKILREKNPEDIKMLRQQWKEFSSTFQKLAKNID